MFIPTLLAQVTDVIGKPVGEAGKAAAPALPVFPGVPKSHAAKASLPGGLPVSGLPATTQVGTQWTPPTPKTPLAAKHPWLTHTFAGLFMISALLLIVLLAAQTTKQEGLSGTIGGRVESAYRPRLGFEQQMQRITTIVAVGFVFFALLVSLSGI
jgi:protein translocase SecG subunit